MIGDGALARPPGVDATSCSPPARAASGFSFSATSRDAHSFSLPEESAASDDSLDDSAALLSLEVSTSSLPDAFAASVSSLEGAEGAEDDALSAASHRRSMAGLCAGTHSTTARSTRATASSMEWPRPVTRACSAWPMRRARSSAKDVTELSAARAVTPTLPTAPAASRARWPMDASQLITARDDEGSQTKKQQRTSELERLEPPSPYGFPPPRRPFPRRSIRRRMR